MGPSHGYRIKLPRSAAQHPIEAPAHRAKWATRQDGCRMACGFTLWEGGGEFSSRLDPIFIGGGAV